MTDIEKLCARVMALQTDVGPDNTEAANFDWFCVQAEKRRIVDAIRKLAPVPAQGAQKTQGGILQLLRDIEANVQRAWKDGSLSAKAWPADIGRRLSDAVNGQDAEGTQGAQGAEGVEALSRTSFEQWYVETAFDYVRNPIGSRDCALKWEGWKEAARRLRNSPQPVSNGPFGAFYVCPTCSGTGVVTQSVHDAARSAGGDDA